MMPEQQQPRTSGSVRRIGRPVATLNTKVVRRVHADFGRFRDVTYPPIPWVSAAPRGGAS